jgi:membrane fusion protein (multidrug efflux system)
MPLEPRDVTIASSYLGSLEPEERVQLKAEVEGVAERVHFDEGQAVAKDAVLANIATATLRVRRDQAVADLKLAESNLHRSESLAGKKLIAPSELDQVRNRRETAFHARRTAQIELDKSIVKTPIAGVVKTKAVSQGEYLSKGALIAEILFTRRLRARISVPEGELRHFREGKSARITLDALPDEQFNGKVVQLGVEADAASRSFPVEIRVDNAQGRMRPGMLARVTVSLDALEQQILVPRYAILEKEDGRFAYVAHNGEAQLRRLEVGKNAGEWVQVVSGLAAGDRLVVTGHQRLGEGQPVRVTRQIDPATVTYWGSGP